MRSFLEVEQGLYDPRRRFAFTNISDEVFQSAFDGQPITIQPHQTVELKHYLAVKLTGELVDKIMIGKAKMDEMQKAQPYFRSPLGSSLGIPAARKVWEDQILVELPMEENSAQSQIERAVIRDELKRDLSSEKSAAPVHTPQSVAEFADITKSEPAPVKAELPVKKIGRPKKVK